MRLGADVIVFSCCCGKDGKRFVFGLFILCLLCCSLSALYKGKSVPPLWIVSMASGNCVSNRQTLKDLQSCEKEDEGIVWMNYCLCTVLCFKMLLRPENGL